MTEGGITELTGVCGGLDKGGVGVIMGKKTREIWEYNIMWIELRIVVSVLG